MGVCVPDDVVCPFYLSPFTRTNGISAGGVARREIRCEDYIGDDPSLVGALANEKGAILLVGRPE